MKELVHRLVEIVNAGDLDVEDNVSRRQQLGIEP
jgi:hypothetical protein